MIYLETKLETNKTKKIGILILYIFCGIFIGILLYLFFVNPK
jgi:hypothetical protein